MSDFIFPSVPIIYVFGDIHGDFELAVRLFKLCSLIDDSLNWVHQEKKTFVVQVGDQIDSKFRGGYGLTDSKDKPEDIKVLKFFTKLDEQAKKDNCRVISLYGNHEIMNVFGITDYVSPANIADAGSVKNRKKLFKPGSALANELSRTRLAVVIIGSHMFAHAGVLNQLLIKYDLKTINEAVANFMLKQLDNKLYDIKEIMFSSDISPFWTRLFGMIPADLDYSDDQCVDIISEAIKIYKTDKIIVGHTPQIYHKKGINSTCNLSNSNLHGHVLRVDVGSSRSFGIQKQLSKEEYTLRRPQALKIVNDKEYFVITENIHAIKSLIERLNNNTIDFKRDMFLCKTFLDKNSLYYTPHDSLDSIKDHIKSFMTKNYDKKYSEIVKLLRDFIKIENSK